MFGWTGKILKIDLNRRQSTILSPSAAYYHKHLGGKGMAGQAIQNMNLMLGCEESAGLGS